MTEFGDPSAAIRPPCRCLLAEAGQEAMAASIREYLELLAPESRADPEVYESRLGICRACPSLRDGTCARCGCYVEARAGKKSLSCPAVPPLW